MAYERKEGHIGGGFSITEMLVSLYNVVMGKDDIFILSKGHACLPYFCLLRDKGYDPEIGGHPERDPENGIHCTTGSLGHGMPVGLGMALAKKIKKEAGKVYVLVSDGECQEGTIWESALIAAHQKLDNFVLLIDNNKLQTLGKTSDILNLENLEEKFKAFNWDTVRIDGHSFPQILSALASQLPGKPKAIVADTTKGKGVSFMENVSKWHTTIPTEEEFQKAYKELS